MVTKHSQLALGACRVEWGDNHASQGRRHSLGQNCSQFSMKLNVVRHIEAVEHQFDVYKVLHSGKDSNPFQCFEID
jgi:hypothetical protein